MLRSCPLLFFDSSFLRGSTSFRLCRPSTLEGRWQLEGLVTGQISGSFWSGLSSVLYSRSAYFLRDKPLGTQPRVASLHLLPLVG